MSLWPAHSSNQAQIDVTMTKMMKNAKKTYCGVWGLKVKGVWSEWMPSPLILQQWPETKQPQISLSSTIAIRTWKLKIAAATNRRDETEDEQSDEPEDEKRKL